MTKLDDDAPVEMEVTDAVGRAHFKIPATGNWLLNEVWTKDVSIAKGIDFETIFSSLILAIPSAPSM